MIRNRVFQIKIKTRYIIRVVIFEKLKKWLKIIFHFWKNIFKKSDTLFTFSPKKSKPATYDRLWKISILGLNHSADHLNMNVQSMFYPPYSSAACICNVCLGICPVLCGQGWPSLTCAHILEETLIVSDVPSGLRTYISSISGPDLRHYPGGLGCIYREYQSDMYPHWGSLLNVKTFMLWFVTLFTHCVIKC